ncbi:hypothetical protein A2U01_0037694, partial [Trifolium medium]|nr:hypothetical protein [Trifolium medium]
MGRQWKEIGLTRYRGGDGGGSVEELANGISKDSTKASGATANGSACAAAGCGAGCGGGCG